MVRTIFVNSLKISTIFENFPLKCSLKIDWYHFWKFPYFKIPYHLGKFHPNILPKNKLVAFWKIPLINIRGSILQWTESDIRIQNYEMSRAPGSSSVIKLRIQDAGGRGLQGNLGKRFPPLQKDALGHANPLPSSRGFEWQKKHHRGSKDELPFSHEDWKKGHAVVIGKRFDCQFDNGSPCSGWLRALI
jgi:hypothetical protein